MLQTERLLLRPWSESDAEALFKYASDPDVGPRAGWSPHKSVEESMEIIRTIFHSDHIWAIELKETQQPIGCIGYYAHGESNINIGENDIEAGYWIAKPYWNRGICTEALRLLIDHCFNVKGFHSIWSDFFVDNPASGRVMEKCGFHDTGEINYCSHLYHANGRPVKIMKLERKDTVQTTELLRTSQSWDGAELPNYPIGKPELVSIRYVFPPGKKLSWHHHDVMNYGVVQQGELTIITLDGKERTVYAGEAVAEMVGTIHHGENRGSVPVILNMFYISQKGLPLSVPHPEIHDRQQEK